MVDRDTATEAPQPGASAHRTANKWLIAAVLASAVCAGLLVGEFVGLLKSPLGVTTAGTSPALQSEQALTVAVARTPGGPGEWANWATVIKHLSDEIDRPLSVRYLSKEDQAAEIIASEDIDIAFVCSHHYVDLVEAGESVGVCTPIINGSSTSRSMLVVKADDPAAGIEDLAGAAVAVSDKSSLGGLSYLSYLTAVAGKVPEEYFGELRLGDTQEANMHDVLDGVVRATVVNGAQVGSWDMTAFKVVEQSEPIGCPPIVVDSEMDDELRTRIEEILVSYDAINLLPAGSTIDGFKALEDEEYAFAYVLRGACGHHTH